MKKLIPILLCVPLIVSTWSLYSRADATESREMQYRKVAEEQGATITKLLQALEKQDKAVGEASSALQESMEVVRMLEARLQASN